MQDARRDPISHVLCSCRLDLASFISPSQHPARDLAVLQPGLSLPWNSWCARRPIRSRMKRRVNHRARYLEAASIRGERGTQGCALFAVADARGMFYLRASRRCSRDPKGGTNTTTRRRRGGWQQCWSCRDHRRLAGNDLRQRGGET
jgi:hypothetical protein